MEKVFYTIREVAKTGLMSEYCLRQLVKKGEVPCIFTGNKCLINLKLLKQKINSEDSSLYEVMKNNGKH